MGGADNVTAESILTFCNNADLVPSRSSHDQCISLSPLEGAASVLRSAPHKQRLAIFNGGNHAQAESGFHREVRQ